MIALEMMRDINKNTVDFRPNFDEHEMEPVALPSRFPNFLVNGGVGIAVGMATNIPPHNLGEVIDGCIMMVDNPDVSVEELMTVIKGPDFPTGGMILGTSGIRDAYTTGKGRIVVRAHAEIEDHAGRTRIIIHDIPYAVNKARLIERMADLVKESSRSRRMPTPTSFSTSSTRTALSRRHAARTCSRSYLTSRASSSLRWSA